MDYGAIIGAGIAATASGISAGVSGNMGYRSRKLAREQFNKSMEFNREQAQISREWSEAMMDKQNRYDSLYSQMQRAKEAGVNPYGILENQGSASANAVGTPSISQGQIPDDHAAGVAAGIQGIGNAIRQGFLDKVAIDNQEG